ncbi:protein chibby homolog 1 isoform X2 [Neoarius graeffei]|uniref:protein chibby homolog 1 isoform X2 n=1 Tax=Neoarius graeffei TaxID=443677 RepID=UPI00298BDFC8|nr:protein chibby homolog 1 isoform X2 [Neoarius graeffei]
MRYIYQCIITRYHSLTKMPLFGNIFSPKKTPPRKSASLSNLHTVPTEGHPRASHLDHCCPNVENASMVHQFTKSVDRSSPSCPSDQGNPLKSTARQSPSTESQTPSSVGSIHSRD